MNIVDIGSARFQQAKNCEDVSPRDTLAEALRLIDSGKWSIGSVMILALHVDPEDGGTTLEIMHGGPATTNERLGILARASHLSISNAHGDV